MAVVDNLHFVEDKIAAIVETAVAVGIAVAVVGNVEEVDMFFGMVEMVVCYYYFFEIAVVETKMASLLFLHYHLGMVRDRERVLWDRG